MIFLRIRLCRSCPIRHEICQGLGLDCGSGDIRDIELGQFCGPFAYSSEGFFVFEDIAQGLGHWNFDLMTLEIMLQLS
jgi:hypothetical protein